MPQPRGPQRFKKPLPHPGETLAEDYLEPLGLNAGAARGELAKIGALT